MSQFNAAGEWVGWITGTASGPLDEPRGVAPLANGDLFVADAAAGRLDLFGPGVVVANATTNQATKIAKTSAILNGVLNGEGKAAKYHFEWGTTEAYGAVTATVAAGSGEEGGDGPGPTQPRHELPLPPGGRKRKWHQCRSRYRIHDRAGGGRIEHWSRHEPHPDKRNADGLTDA